MGNAIKLKPCPFCGSTQNRALHYYNYGAAGEPEYAVVCSICCAEGPLFHKDVGGPLTKDKAALMWNRRAAFDAAKGE